MVWMVELAEYTLVTEPSSAYLNPRQQQDYRDEREACLRWLLAEGKSPDEFDGYAPGTVKPRSARMDQFYRFVWDKEGGYTINVDHGHADAWQEHLARRDVSATHKRNCTKALKMLYKWHHHQRGMSPYYP